MGGKSSVEEHKDVDTSGQVNNNIILKEAVDIKNGAMLTCLYIICGLKIIEFILYLYTNHVKHIKKRERQQQSKPTA